LLIPHLEVHVPWQYWHSWSSFYAW